MALYTKIKTKRGEETVFSDCRIYVFDALAYTELGYERETHARVLRINDFRPEQWNDLTSEEREMSLMHENYFQSKEISKLKGHIAGYTFLLAVTVVWALLLLFRLSC